MLISSRHARNASLCLRRGGDGLKSEGVRGSNGGSRRSRHWAQLMCRGGVHMDRRLET
jgi:hypothetical protein